MLSDQEMRKRMEDALAALRREFAAVRTGKATPALLDTVRVAAYGSKLPLNQIATVSAPEASLIVVHPFDSSLIGEIEKGILRANLGLNPANDGQFVRVPVPPLNEERRREYARLLHKLAEEARISVRYARRERNEAVRAGMRAGEIPQDAGHRELDDIQRLTDRYAGQIEALLKAKEKEVMSV